MVLSSRLSMGIGKAGHLYTSSTSPTDMIDGDGNPVTTPRNSRPTNIYLPIECPTGVQGHFPDPYDCSAFHYCNGQFFWSLGGKWHVLRLLGGVDKPAFCDAGLFWDKSKSVATDCWTPSLLSYRARLSMAEGCSSLWVQKVLFTDRWNVAILSGQHKCPANGQRIRFVATHSCCHFYECINGHLKEQVCPLHKLYSVESKSCENFQVVTCGSRKKCIDPCEMMWRMSILSKRHSVCLS